MVILRPTRKLQKTLPVSTASVPAETSDTILGDWYVNRVVIARRPLLMLVSSESLFAVLTPARDVKTLPDRLGELVAHRLGRLSVPSKLIDAEIEAMDQVRIAPTTSRSVLGIMVEYAKMLSYIIEPDLSEHAALFIAEEELWENPCFAGKPHDQVIFPRDETLRLLQQRGNAV